MKETEMEPPWAGDGVVNTTPDRQQVDARFKRSGWQMPSLSKNPLFHTGSYSKQASPLPWIPRSTAVMAATRRN